MSLFDAELEKLKSIEEHLADPVAVALGEFVAENLFGDPGLRKTISAATGASEAASAALMLVRIAIKELSELIERTEEERSRHDHPAGSALPE